MIKLIKLLFLIPLMLIVSSCATQKVPISHPNQISSFDGYAYDTLVSAQAALNSAKTQVAAYPAMKEPLNQAIAAYNAAESTYKTYHSIGKLDPTTEAQLGESLQQLVSAISIMLNTKGGKP